MSLLTHQLSRSVAHSHPQLYDLAPTKLHWHVSLPVSRDNDAFWREGENIDVVDPLWPQLQSTKFDRMGTGGRRVEVICMISSGAKKRSHEHAPVQSFHALCFVPRVGNDLRISAVLRHRWTSFGLSQSWGLAFQFSISMTNDA